MKKEIMWVAMFLLTVCGAAAQSISLQDSIPPLLEVTCNKTSSLIFPTVIKSVDRGSRDVLAQKASGVENVLQLKANRENFPETNLTVITADGILHQFTVRYSKKPGSLSLKIESGGNEPEQKLPTLIFRSVMSEPEMEKYATGIINARQTLKFKKQSRNKMDLSLKGIYIKDNVLFYHFQIINHSNIDYNVDFLRLYIQDKVKVKRTASQELDLRPLFKYGSIDTIKGNSTSDVVYALEKFTIPDSKKLLIEMFEKRGGRNLNLSIKNKTIINARLIP